MSDVSNTTSAATDQQQEHSFVVRWAVSILFFGCTALILTLVVVVLTRPGRYPVTLGDSLLRLKEIDSAVTELRSEEQRLIAASDELRRRTPTPTVKQLDTFSVSRADVGTFLRDLVRSMHTSHGVDVVLTSIVQDSKTVELHGEIHAGEKSLRVTADFIDALRLSPAVLHVTEPEYILATAKDGSYFAPLTLLLTLRTREDAAL